MKIDLIMKLKSNPMYIDYIHKNSYWYKILNRDSNKFDEFVENVKIYYGMRPIDKVNNMVNKLEMIENVLNVLK